MASEGTVRISLNVRIGKIDYRSNPTSFRVDLSSAVGPTPGYILVPTAGVAIVFSQLVTPGIYWLQNLDLANFIQYGIRDPGTGKFYPMNEILPGEFWPGRFSRNLLSDYYNTGTGTDADVNQLWFKADKAACGMQIHAFEK